jgi:hypothetical protein
LDEFLFKPSIDSLMQIPERTKDTTTMTNQTMREQDPFFGSPTFLKPKNFELKLGIFYKWLHPSLDDFLPTSLIVLLVYYKFFATATAA